MQKVAHPNIIGYYDSFVSQENMHIVMEYADGGTLYTVLRSALHTGPLAESSVLAYFAQLLMLSLMMQRHGLATFWLQSWKVVPKHLRLFHHYHR